MAICMYTLETAPQMNDLPRSYQCHMYIDADAVYMYISDSNIPVNVYFLDHPN